MSDKGCTMFIVTIICFFMLFCNGITWTVPIYWVFLMLLMRFGKSNKK